MQKFCCPGTSTETNGVVKVPFNPLVLAVRWLLTKVIDELSSCFLVQRVYHVVVFGGVGSDLAYMELGFRSFEQHLRR